MVRENRRSISKKTFRLLCILFAAFLVCAVFCLPFAIRGTWAWGQRTDHTLTYTKNNLSWNSGTEVTENGSAILTLFTDDYIDVKSENGDKVLAPGTDGENIIRLVNDVKGEVSYTAVAYKTQSDKRLPIKVSFTSDGASYTGDYYLPNGVSKDAVISAYSGKLAGKKAQEFIIDWGWDFEHAGTLDDLLDTELGNEEDLAEVEIGVYIVVMDDNVYIPKTGDSNRLALWILIACLASAAATLVVILSSRERRRE